VDDPRIILAEAGVECPELDFAAMPVTSKGWVNEDGVALVREVNERHFTAFLALARLVAKYKWQRDEVLAEYCEVVDGEWGISRWPTEEQPPSLDDWLDDEEAAARWVGERVAELDRRWEERAP
jgi:hypothetical protein